MTRFDRAAQALSDWLGHPTTLFANVIVILIWAGAGPFAHFSDTWQLVVNTGTTVLTYLMLFILQASANRDTREIKAMLQELIRALPDAEQPDIDQSAG